MARNDTYIGFNTVEALEPPYTLIDIELVKQDLLNHFHTRIGERVMLPDFGSSIWNLLMDPYDDMTISQIIDDASRIVSSDPRVELVDVQVQDSEQTLRLEIQLNFLPGFTPGQLAVEFDRQAREAT